MTGKMQQQQPSVTQRPSPPLGAAPVPAVSQVPLQLAAEAAVGTTAKPVSRSPEMVSCGAPELPDVDSEPEKGDAPPLGGTENISNIANRLGQGPLDINSNDSLIDDVDSAKTNVSSGNDDNGQNNNGNGNNADKGDNGNSLVLKSLLLEESPLPEEARLRLTVDDFMVQQKPSPLDTTTFESHKRRRRPRRTETSATKIKGPRAEPQLRMNLSPSHRSEFAGVYLHGPKQEWRAVIGHGNRRHQKTFSVRKYGFEEAKRQAERFRAQFEALSGVTYTPEHYYADKVAIEATSKNLQEHVAEERSPPAPPEATVNQMELLAPAKEMKKLKRSRNVDTRFLQAPTEERRVSLPPRKKRFAPRAARMPTRRSPWTEQTEWPTMEDLLQSSSSVFLTPPQQQRLNSASSDDRMQLRSSAAAKQSPPTFWNPGPIEVGTLFWEGPSIMSPIDKAKVAVDTLRRSPASASTTSTTDTPTHAELRRVLLQCLLGRPFHSAGGFSYWNNNDGGGSATTGGGNSTWNGGDDDDGARYRQSYWKENNIKCELSYGGAESRVAVPDSKTPNNNIKAVCEAQATAI